MAAKQRERPRQRQRHAPAGATSCARGVEESGGDRHAAPNGAAVDRLPLDDKITAVRRMGEAMRTDAPTA